MKNKILNKKFIGIAILIIVIGAMFYYRRAANNRNGNNFEESEVKRGIVKEELILSGNIKADQHVELQFVASGLLSWVGVKEGDEIKKGQAVASLDTRQLKKTLQKYLNTYEINRNSFEQSHDDYSGYELEPDVEERERLTRIIRDAQLSLNNSVLDVELQDLAVRLSTIFSPIEGIVTLATNQYAGVNILATQTKYEVVNPKTIYFDVSADQTDVTQITLDQEVTVTLDSFPDTNLTGNVKWISYTPSNEEIGTVYNVKVEFPSIDFTKNLYRIGMTGDARFTLNQVEDVFYVPSAFVNSDDKGDYVLLNSKENKVYVEVGLEGEDYKEIIGDINEGDKIFD